MSSKNAFLGKKIQLHTGNAKKNSSFYKARHNNIDNKYNMKNTTFAE